jgi:hypothetical protein
MLVCLMYVKIVTFNFTLNEHGLWKNVPFGDEPMEMMCAQITGNL